MKKTILTWLLLLAVVPIMRADIPDDCEAKQQENGWPSYYCECRYNFEKFILPVDIQLTDTIWYKARLSTLFDGVTAYLHTDCDVQFDVYDLCTRKEPKYSATFKQNQANTIDAQGIKDKLAEMGLTDVDGTFYICISPVGGFGGRLICSSYQEGILSPCENPLYIFPEISLTSSHEEDVYVVDPNYFPASTSALIHWDADDVPCTLRVMRNSCDGELIQEVELQDQRNVYFLPGETLDMLWENDEVLYMQFLHPTASMGHIHCLTTPHNEFITDTVLCQGKGLYVNDTVLTSPTTYIYDTVHFSDTHYSTFGYRLTFTEPIAEYDTLLIPTAELQAGYYYAAADAYIYAAGDYTYEVVAENECTRLIFLTVQEDITSAIENPWDNTNSIKAELILENGIIYIQRANQRFTLLGDPVE